MCTIKLVAKTIILAVVANALVMVVEPRAATHNDCANGPSTAGLDDEYSDLADDSKNSEESPNGKRRRGLPFHDDLPMELRKEADQIADAARHAAQNTMITEGRVRITRSGAAQLPLDLRRSAVQAILSERR